MPEHYDLEENHILRSDVTASNKVDDSGKMIELPDTHAFDEVKLYQ